MIENYISKSTDETIKVAKDFARTLDKGSIVLLDGDLGAGKTVFAKGVVDYFSSGKIIAVSPTFVIVNVYETNPPIYHFDLYRISDESELSAIGAEEYLYSNVGISLIEWPSRAENFFNESAIKVYIEKINDNERKISIERSGV